MQLHGDVIEFMRSDAGRNLFGKTFAIRVDAVRFLLCGEGESLSAIARKHGVSRQAMTRHCAAIREALVNARLTRTD